ncbi:hypothetical protein WOLCODRAFT_134888 [Wolfiporia cocos MD-104 SS10]|uniref:Histone deacetylase complex subunit SAP30 Sin3 binding domain-containing protein n=1 Tax=Wolfiporia cocos (strain MD-104) TaxID=742152 RepID=A0A2H3J8U9_WOLCO|nr:hypothetical protein WOLCODRAFT_134888 [Wolfiporia cocos MD-104 SS10]
MAPSTPKTQSAAPAANTTTAAPRARPPAARKKAHALADDAAYHAASGVAAGTKRAAVDRVEGEPRLKRKRADVSNAASSGVAGASGGVGTSSSANANANRRDKDRMDGEGRISLVDFSALPTSALHEYLIQFDLIPEVDPSPLGADDPPPPSTLLRSRGHARTASPQPPLPITPANRPRREVGSRRRSTRLIEDDQSSELSILPVLADIDEVHGVLAAIAQKHFREHTIKEVDTLASFMFAVKAKNLP